MALSEKQKDDLLKFAGIAIGAVAAYKLVFKKKKPTTVVAEVIETPAEVVKKAAKMTEDTISDTVKKVDKTYKKSKKKANKVAKDIKKDVKKTLAMDDNKDGKVDSDELAKRGKAPTDANIIKANKLKGKAAKDVKSGKPDKVSATRKKYLDAANMTASELEDWSKTDLSKKASLSREPIERNIRLLKLNTDEWTEKDAKDALKTIRYLAGAKKIKRAKKEVGDSGYTKNEIALKNWGYDVRK